MGEGTPDAFKCFSEVEAKIDDYFARCQLAAFDLRAEGPLNPDVRLYSDISSENFSRSREDIAQLSSPGFACQVLHRRCLFGG